MYQCKQECSGYMHALQAYFYFYDQRNFLKGMENSHVPHVSIKLQYKSKCSTTNAIL